MIFFDIVILPIKSNSWYESPVIAALLGFFLAFATNIINDQLKERKELTRYEYILLKETQDILESSKPDKKRDIDDFLAKFYTDLRFTKLDSMILIKDSLDKARKNEDFSSEKKRINTRLRKLIDEGIISKIKNEIRKFISLFLG